MTKHLFNYCVIDWYEDELRRRGLQLPQLVEQLGVDGIEQFVYGLERPQPDYKELTVGVHLSYWPYWLDFWQKKAKRLHQQFRTIRDRRLYFKEAMSCDEWLSVIRRNIDVALTLAPEYLVWHVSEADNETAFTFDFRYDDWEVLRAAAEVFNAVADEIPPQVTVLFENLWWPGLRLTEARKVRYFFDRIERKNVGIMLDTGHLMNTEPKLRTEAEATDYICRTIDKLGPYAELIKGLHLNCSLSGSYLQSFERRAPAVATPEVIWQHIAAIDQHRPFTTAAVRQILQCVEPLYVNHELVYDSLEDLETKLRGQLQLLR